MAGVAVLIAAAIVLGLMLPYSFSHTCKEDTYLHTQTHHIQATFDSIHPSLPSLVMCSPYSAGGYRGRRCGRQQDLLCAR